MKNLFSTAILGVAVLFTMVSCEKDEVKIPNEELPTAAKSFINEYFAGAKVTSAIKDTEGLSNIEFEVKLDNGAEINFDNTGLWQDVEMINDRTPLPNTSFILPAIVEYVNENYTTVGINGIDRELNGFDVELTNDVDLVFDKDGNFIRIDR